MKGEGIVSDSVSTAVYMSIIILKNLIFPTLY